MRRLFICGSLALMAGCASSGNNEVHEKKVGEQVQRSLHYSVLSKIGLPKTFNYDHSLKKYFLVQDGDGWKVARTGDLSQKNVERVVVNTATGEIVLTATEPVMISGGPSRGPGPGDSWMCLSGLGGNGYRARNDYSICSSNLTKNVTSAGAAALGSLNLLLGTTRTFQAVDQEKILEIAESSGLLDMVERDKADMEKAAHDAAEERRVREQEAEQVRLNADKQAEQGDANAKYQRGVEVLGAASWSATAQQWFEKAATAGSVDALFKLGTFQKEHYRNEFEAEQLWIKAAKGGSVAAKNALNDLAAERNRKADQLARERQLQARKLAQVREIGQAVCTSFAGTEKRVIGIDNYQRKNIYGPEEPRIYKVRGFTENSNGSKIQVRIGGVQKFDSLGNNLGNVDRVDGETVYQNGAVIWGEASSWNPC